MLYRRHYLIFTPLVLKILALAMPFYNLIFRYMYLIPAMYSGKMYIPPSFLLWSIVVLLPKQSCKFHHIQRTPERADLKVRKGFTLELVY